MKHQAQLLISFSDIGILFMEDCVHLFFRELSFGGSIFVL